MAYNFYILLRWACRRDSKILQENVTSPHQKSDITPKPLLQCTHHLCHVRVHWHLKDNYQDYWRVKIAIINFNYRLNFTDWSLVVQHPNLNNVTQVYSFEYMPLLPYESISEFLEMHTKWLSLFCVSALEEVSLILCLLICICR